MRAKKYGEKDPKSPSLHKGITMKRVYFVKVMMKVAIEINVPTDDSPKDNAGGTFHEERALELLGST